MGMVKAAGVLAGSVKEGSLGRTLLRAGSLSLALRVAAVGIGFAGSVVLARVLGAESLGVYAFVLAAASMLAVPLQFGLPTLMLRETARADARADWGRMKGNWVWSTRLTLLASAAALAAGYLALYLIGDRIDPVLRSTFLLALLLVPLITLEHLRSAALKGLRRLIEGQIPDAVVRPLLLMLLVLFGAWLSGGSLSAPEAMGLHVVAALAAFGLGALLLMRARPPGLRSAVPDMSLRSEWRHAVVPLALISALQIVNQTVDIVMLGLLRPAAEVGAYKVAVAAGTIASFGVTTAALVFAPYFARLHEQGQMRQLQRLVALRSAAGLAVTVPVVLAFVVYGEDFLTLVYGPAFAAAFLPLVILSLGHAVNACFGGVGTLLQMSGHERQSLRALYLCAAANVVLNLALIPHYGAVGAAFATAVTVSLKCVLYWFTARRVLGIYGGPFALFHVR